MSELFKDAKEITISDEIGGVFSTDSEFDNERHRISMSITYSRELTEQEIILKRELLKKILRDDMATRERQSYLKYLEKVRRDIRWTKIDGELYPSVTSILETVNPTDFFMDGEQLKSYAARGNVLDTILQKFIETGQWFEYKDLPETWADVKEMKRGKLEMSGNLPAWVEKYKPQFIEGHKRICNKQYRYTGTPDVAFGMLDNIPTLFDLKNRTSINKMEKVKIFKQMAAYAKGENLGHQIEQLCMIIVNDGTQQGFSKPVTTTEIDKYFELFLSDLSEFNRKFNL